MLFAMMTPPLGIPKTIVSGPICFFSSEDANAAILVSDLWGSYTEVDFLRCLSHECNHAAMTILDSVRIGFDVENQEALCYLQDFIFSKILSALWKETRKRNPKSLIIKDKDK